MAKTDIVMIDLDRPRELRFGFKALKMIEGTLKKSLIEVVQAGLNNLKSSDLENILYAGLKEDDSELDLNKIENLLDKTSYIDLISKMTDAINKAYGSDKEEDNERFKNPDEAKKK